MTYITGCHCVTYKGNVFGPVIIRIRSVYFLQNCYSAIFNKGKEILSFSGRQFSKATCYENEHECSNILNKQKNKGSVALFVFYSLLYLTSMLFNDQIYLLEDFD